MSARQMVRRWWKRQALVAQKFDSTCFDNQHVTYLEKYYFIDNRLFIFLYIKYRSFQLSCKIKNMQMMEDNSSMWNELTFQVDGRCASIGKWLND